MISKFFKIVLRKQGIYLSVSNDKELYSALVAHIYVSLQPSRRPPLSLVIICIDGTCIDYPQYDKELGNHISANSIPCKQRRVI